MLTCVEAVDEAGRAAWCEVWNAGGPLLPAAPVDLAFEERTLPLVQRLLAVRDGATVGASALRTHFAFSQPGRLALDLRVAPHARAQGIGGILLSFTLARARELGATVVRAYAWEHDAAWTRLAARHGFQEVERDRFLVLDVERAPLPPPGLPPVSDLEREPEETLREAWELEHRLHAALETAAPVVPAPLAAFAARIVEAPGCGRDRVLVTRADDGSLAGICALRRCAAAPQVAYHLFTGVAPSARGRGHARALKAAAAAWARREGVAALVADTSPANAAMLRVNLACGYVAVGDVRNLELDLTLN